MGALAVVVAMAGAVGVTDLGDRDNVQRVVEPPVPAPRQAVHDAPGRGELDRGGAGVGGVVAEVGNRNGSPV